MRNPERIKEVLGLIKDIWSSENHSDLRFFQLVEVFQGYVNGINRKPQDTDVFYMEDSVLLKALREYKEGLGNISMSQSVPAENKEDNNED